MAHLVSHKAVQHSLLLRPYLAAMSEDAEIWTRTALSSHLESELLTIIGQKNFSTVYRTEDSVNWPLTMVPTPKKNLFLAVAISSLFCLRSPCLLESQTQDIKRTGSRDRIKLFWQKWKLLGLIGTSTGFKMSLHGVVLISIFHAFKVRTYGSKIIIGDVFKITVLFSTILFQNGLPYTPGDFYEQASHIQGPQTIFTETRGPRMVF